MADVLVDRSNHNAAVPDQDQTSSLDMIKYTAYYTTSRSNATLHLGGPSTPAIYYVESELLTFKPWLFLRKGTLKTSPMVAFVRFHLTSRHMLVGRGDCQKDSESKLVWEKLEREKNILQCSGYSFMTSEGSANGELKRYSWNKDTTKAGATAYECIDENGLVVSHLRSGGLFNWKKGGEIDVMKSLDEGLREILLSTAFGVYYMEFVNYRSLRKGYEDEEKK